ncbi:unnamed protein product [Larinioides sclopetarius]|uniref:Uncharacterized protein n=1 Tax=Larinioides sclopetarius TaxID=280406 RepID=A0AAV2A7D3_9ARAC
MSAPALHDLQFSRNKFPEFQLPDVWRISTSKSNDLLWNIVLAYLNSFPVSNDNELTRRITCLTGHREVNVSIKQFIETYNPFLNRNAYFHDELMIDLVNKFKNRVEDNINNGGRLFPTPDKESEYLEASSKLLFCNILLISLEAKTTKVFPAETIYRNSISILENLNSERRDGQDRFSFCVPKEMGIEKKRQALTEILKRTKKFKNKENIIKKVSNLPYITENFLLSLLKNDYSVIIPIIYESSSVLSKLADAGFETDPRTKDSSGKSAFFYALKTEKPQDIVFFLYDHAANACLKTSASVRTPNPVIVENLLNFKYYLKELLKQIESEEMNENSRCLLRDLCRFNEFQTEICKNLNIIRNRINYYEEDKTGKKIETSRRKETILTILKTYEAHFNYTDGESEPFKYTDAFNNYHLHEFSMHKNYFNNLDFNTVLMFFDNLYLLKERLILEKDAYLNVESSFFLYVSFRKHLKKYQKMLDIYFPSEILSFQERLLLRKKLCSFRKTLEETKLSEKNMVDTIPDEVVKTLTNLPEIYGDFFISRLHHYLEAATKVTVKDSKSILVIERCLQVIGECCIESEFKSVQSIIISALSKDFSKCLNKIRHNLSHIEYHEIFYRIKLEEDIELFIEIQKELFNFKKLLSPIYSIHKYGLDQYFLTYFMKSVKQCREINILEERENQPKAILPSFDFFRDIKESELSVSTKSCLVSWKRCIDYIYSSIREEINDLNRNGNILNENSISHYKQIVKNMLSAIEEALKNFEFTTPKEVAELDSLFFLPRKRFNLYY